MKNKILSLVISLFFTACSGGGWIGKLPEIKNSDEAVDVYLIRSGTMFGISSIINVYIDGDYVLDIGSSKYTKFQLKAGEYDREHDIKAGTKNSGYKKIDLFCSLGETYYLYIETDLNGIHITKVSEQRGKELITDSNYIE
jgi:hypothetical protein